MGTVLLVRFCLTWSQENRPYGNIQKKQRITNYDRTKELIHR
jgi:hypothetical protein